MNLKTLPPLTKAAAANAEWLPIALQRLGRVAAADPALGQWAPRPEVIQALHDEGLTCIQVLARACEAYADRPALGDLADLGDLGDLTDLADLADLADPTGPAVASGAGRRRPASRTLTYRDLWERTVALATGLARDPRTALRAGEAVGIHGFGSIEYVLADLACLHVGAVSAVLQTGMPAEELRHLVAEAGLTCMIASSAGLEDLLDLLRACPSVRSVVVMDLPGAGTAQAEAFERVRARAALPVLTLRELEAQGRRAPPLAPFHPAPGTDPLVTLMYTSGSTGFPKGAMLTERLWRHRWELDTLTQFAAIPNIGLNFYPLSHILGRQGVLRTLVVGGITYFTRKSDLSTLFEDIRHVRPTFLTLVPRISELIHQAYRTEVLRVRRTGLPEAVAEAQVRKAMRHTFLGDRLTLAMVGSAPTAPEVLDFLATCFEIPVYEIYGSTEAGLLSIDGALIHPAVSRYRLAEVPELGYRLTDRPHPRGELRVQARQAIPGFFRNAAATQALYDEEGLLRTGDIVEEEAPGQVVWVDRINNVVKLAQGEYVTLWRLESVFSSGSPCLDQVYLYANSQRSYLLAVLVPDWATVQGRLGLRSQDPDSSELRALLRAELNRVAFAASLRPFEVPRDFLVATGRWTGENGLLTGIDKPARPQLKAKYGEALEALYRQLEETQLEGLADLDSLEEGAPLAEKVRRAAAAVLGVPELEPAAGSFRDFGGDSMGALSLSATLEALCGMPVPASLILDPGRTLAALAQQLEARRNPQADAHALPDFATLHGQRPTVIRAQDLTLGRCLGPVELAEAEAVAAQPLPGPVRTVLVTGANGFLGHTLALEWLERMAAVGGRVYALVRGADDPAAARRLEAAYHSGDAALEARFTRLAADHLGVLAGRIDAPRLALAPEVYERLATEVDLIVHPGALVNHVLGYEQLFEPNVLGTVHLIRLALHGRRKRLDFVSTIGVLEGARRPGKVAEQDGVDGLRTEWPVDGGYAHGYATSKWASEVLLKDLHARFRTPLRVFRPGLIMPHRHYRGQANAPDLLSRLLVSVIATGIAPRSFYAEGAARAHYDGLPVDFIAAAMAALSSAHGEGQATYQVSNDHWDDGVSLDTLMDWVQTAGYPLARLPDHGAWFAQFSERLQALPPSQRQHSALPILHLWAQPITDWGRERVEASGFHAQVRRSRPGGEGDLLHLEEAYLHKYLADLQQLGLLKAGP